MHSIDLLVSPSPSLSEQLRRRTNELQSRIIRLNINTKFAQNASELNDLRHAIAGRVDQMDYDTLSESFRKTVCFTTYDSYAPLVAKLFERPCKASEIVDLLSPGLPNFILESSSTSSGITKIFPKYNSWLATRSSDEKSMGASNPLRKRTQARISYLWVNPVDVQDENDRNITTVYHTCGVVASERMLFNLHPEDDRERMSTLVLDHAAPYATGFIKKWRPFLLMHGLFAICSRSIETIYMAFINTFVDMMHYLDKEFDTVVDCIANGTIPELDGIEDVRPYLEPNISPDPERAAELRALGRPSSLQGWCSFVWPNLRSITAISSGSFMSSVPLAEWYLGPSIKILPLIYASTEAKIGFPYNPLESNQFKCTGTDILEFLEISESDSISSLSQIWEVETGRRYELVLTTWNGLWRYRLGDVIEICGFDPTDGVPIISFVERRNVAVRFPDIMVTEKELSAVISSFTENMSIKIADWTTTLDNRKTPVTITFFIELSGDRVPDLAAAKEYASNELSDLNQNIAWALDNGLIGEPTIQVVRAGTFGDFRQLKLDEGSGNLGQLKVPVVLPKAAYVSWFSDRVVHDI